jgi:G6PDH family F420-dependent oxidoreductase
MMPGRFWLGLGTGEALNEHVTGAYWPPADERRAMLREAVEIIRAMWTGENTDYRGDYFEVVDARLYTYPHEPPPIYVAAGGENSAELAADIGDGIISTASDTELLRTFDDNGGASKPKLGQVTVCWGQDEDAARRLAHEIWPTSGLRGELTQELPLPRHYEQAAANVTVDTVAKAITCGPDPERHIDAVRKFIDAGYDHIYIHQVGPDQDGFFDFYRREVLPALTK